MTPTFFLGCACKGGYRECPACDGNGWFDTCPSHGGANCPCPTKAVECGDCDATGQLLCEDCNGTTEAAHAY